jgi:hypothetical protein
LTNAKADAESAVPARCRGVGLPEALEDVRQEFGCDALAAVADMDLDVRVRARDAHVDAARRAV